MKQIIIGKNEDGRRIDVLISRTLPGAGKGFVYKMLRKKNIVLNGRKCEAGDRVREGDVISFYLSDETFESFSHRPQDAVCAQENEYPYDPSFERLVIYADNDVILLDKPAGMLSQKAYPEDISANEYLIGYLLEKGKITKDELKSFKPSVCNRLDRNTSGILCAGISLKGSRELTALLRDRRVEKYYRCIVKGRPAGERNGYVRLRSYFAKDEKNNKARIEERPFEGSVPVEIEYSVLAGSDSYSLLSVRLITGKSHQIRAQLASAGHPIAGDAKYGDPEDNELLKKKYGVKHQLLAACCLIFPEDTRLEELKGRSFEIPLPDSFFPV